VCVCNEEGERLGVMSPSNRGLFVGSLGVKRSGVEGRAELIPCRGDA
jgi:hypothetical protein